MEADSEYQDFRQAIEYAKIPQMRNSLSDFNEKPIVSPGVRVVCLRETWELSDRAVESLKDFVGRGGMLYFTEKNLDERFAFLLGLRPDYDMKIDNTAKGIHFRTPVLPGMEGLKIEREAFHNGFRADNFVPTIKVHASSVSQENYPLLLEHQIGGGRVVLYNSSNPFEKQGRGLFFAGLLLGLEGIPYPQLNVASIFLDDFPSPLYKTRKEPVWSEMQLNMADFVEAVWWPDMEQLAKRHRLKYTAYVCFDYNDRVTPPYMFREWDESTGAEGARSIKVSAALGRKVIEAGHEIGLHGYNHQSLLKSVWPGKLEMVTALEAATKKWRIEGFGELPISYVPPSNYIDSLGVQAISEALPGMRYLHSTYLGTFSEGGDREFGPEPWNNRFFNFPRISSGFLFGPEEQFNISSHYLYTGIWTHFIHPDDVYQIEKDETTGDFRLRNWEGLGWRKTPGGEGMYARFSRILTELRARHPMMRFMTATEASEVTARWRYAIYEHLPFDDYYTVGTEHYRQDPSHRQFWAVFVRPENRQVIQQSIEEQQISYQDVEFLDGYLYTLESSEQYITLPEIQNRASTGSDLKELEKDFLASRESLLPFVNRLQNLVNRENYAKATSLMEIQFRNGLVKSQYWLEYFDYMSWDGRQEEAWDFLDKIYRERQQQVYGAIAKELAEVHGYASDSVRELWQGRQIEWGQADVSILEAFIRDFNRPEAKYFIKKAFEQLLAFDDTETRRYAYLNHLLQYEMDGALEIIRELSPCQGSYRDLAYPMAWALANKGYYDSALEWARCTPDLDQETLDYWLFKSEKMYLTKENDEYRYFKVLLHNEPERAAMELSSEPACISTLQILKEEIANNLADYGFYIKASQWLDCATEVPMHKQVEWLYQSGRYTELIERFTAYAQKYPQDEKVLQNMVRYFLYMERTADAAEILSRLAPGPEYSRLLDLWNAAITTSDLPVKEEMISTYPKLFKPSVSQKTTEELRLKEGNSLHFESNSVNDRLDPTVLRFYAGYDLQGKKGAVHQFRGVRSFAYPINFIPEDTLNGRSDLLGIAYNYKTHTGKGREFQFGLQLENDGEGKTFYHLRAAVEWSRDKSFKSINLRYAPVQTGPGYIAGIYQGNLTGYYEWSPDKKWKLYSGMTASYYTDGETDLILNTGNYLKLLKNSSWHSGPFAEISYGLSSVDRRDGFPYWTADQRFYGGAGLSFTLGEQEDPFYLVASAAYFYENQGEPSFERYTCQLVWRIRNYTTLSAGGEIYTIERFFSNTFRLGLVYQL